MNYDQTSVDLESQHNELKALGISVIDQSSIEHNVEVAVDNAVVSHQRKQKLQILKKEIKDISLRQTKLKNKDEDFEKRLSDMQKRFTNPRVYMELEKALKENSSKIKELQKRKSFLDAKYLKAEADASELDDLDLELEEGEILDGENTNEKEKLIREGEMTPFGTFIKSDSAANSLNPQNLTQNITSIDQNETQLRNHSTNFCNAETDISQSKLFKLLTNSTPCPIPDKVNSKSDTPVTTSRAKLTEFEKYLEDQIDKQKIRHQNKSSGSEVVCSKKNKNNSSYGIFNKRKKKPKEFKSFQVGDSIQTLKPKEKSPSKKKIPSKKVTQKKSSNVSETDKIASSNTKRPKISDFDDCSSDRNSDSDYKQEDEISSGEDYEPAEDSLEPKAKKLKLSSTNDAKKGVKDDGNIEDYSKRIYRWKKERLVAKKRRIDNDESDEEEDENLFEEFQGGFKIPLNIWNKLYKYQKTGVRWLWELHSQGCGGILGDEMGLGKTIQVIAFLIGISYSRLTHTGRRWTGLGPVLIVCPATVLHQWVKEFHKWWPPFRVAVLHDSGSFIGSRSSLIHNINRNMGILIVSYTGLRKSLTVLLQYEWHYLILDEGHKIRNPEAQITVAVKRFSTPHRLILSGSPIQNSLKELWSLFDFIFPCKLGTLVVFLQQFAVPITQGGYANASKLEVQTAFKCATILRDTINPYLLRRMKSDVRSHLTLPDKNEQVLFCGLTDEQRDLYRNYIEGKEVQNIMKGRMKVFVGLINLRKICNHPDLYSGGVKQIVGETATDNELQPENKFGWYKKAGKMMVLHSILKLWNKQSHRVLLFTQSKQMLLILEKFLTDEAYTYLKMDGTTNVGSRQPMIEKYNTDSSIFVFLLTTRVGGLGVNLTGADRVIIYDPDWNPSTDTQARERAWRIGQERHVTIYRLLTAGTIEEKIYHRQIFKQFLTNRVLKDPKQQRFFKSNDLFELFTLSEGNKEKTESSVLFAGTGSEIKIKDKSKRKTIPSQEIKKREIKISKARITDNEKVDENFVPKLISDNDKVPEMELVNKENVSNKKSSLVGTQNCSLEENETIEKCDPFIPDEVVWDPPTDHKPSLGGPQCDTKDDKDELKLETSFDQNKKLKMMELAKKLSKKIADNKGKTLLTPKTTEDEDWNLPKSEKSSKKGKKFEGERIEYLIKKRKMKKTDEEEKDLTNKSQDDFVLKKLFQKSGVHTALSHDVIVNSGDPDFLLLESEADKVAQEAMKQVRLSRRNLKVQNRNKSIKNKFGMKKSSILVDLKSEIKSTKINKPKKESNAFDGNISEETKPPSTSFFSSFDESKAESSNVLSSSQLLKRMKERNKSAPPVGAVEPVRATAGAIADGYDPAYPSTAENMEVEELDLDPTVQSHVELLTDIRNFVAFQADKDGQASTNEILKKFKDRLPSDKTHIFKALLNNICDFRRNPSGEGLWYMKEEFR